MKTRKLKEILTLDVLYICGASEGTATSTGNEFFLIIIVLIVTVKFLFSTQKRTKIMSLAKTFSITHECQNFDANGDELNTINSLDAIHFYGYHHRQIND